MKKIILLLLLLSSLIYAKGFDINYFATKIGIKGVAKLSKTLKVFKKSKFVKNTPKVKLKKPVSKNILKITSVANKIAKKGKFQNKLMATTTKPLHVIQQYARYGDEYLNIMKKFSTKAIEVTPKTFRMIKKKFPKMPNTAIKSISEFNDKMVIALQYTGKKGWQATKQLYSLAKKYPKSVAIGGFITWYVLDPQGFMEKKHELINWLKSTAQTTASDITEVTLGVTSGIADGFINTVKEKLTPSSVIVIVLIFISYLLWKFRFFIKRIFRSKIESSIEQYETENKKNIYHSDEQGRL